MMTDPSGHPPRTELVTNILVATAGIPFLVDAALASAAPLLGGIDRAGRGRSPSSTGCAGSANRNSTRC